MATVSLATPARPRLPTILAGACVVLALAGLVASVAAGPAAALSGHVYEDATTALIWALLAGLLLRRTTTPPRRSSRSSPAARRSRS